MTPVNKDNLKGILKRAQEEHKRIFGEELTAAELNGFFCSLLEYKRRKWIEGALGDYGPEELIGFLDVLDEKGATENE